MNWVNLLCLYKILSSSNFQNARLLIISVIIQPRKRMSLVVFDIEWLERKIVKELGVFKDGIVLGYTFLPPKDYKSTFQAKRNTKNLHGINWNNGKLEYTELSSIIH